MMEQQKNKLCRAAKIRRNRRGETLTETLIAMLIIVLSSVLFLTMVGASGRIFRNTEKVYGRTGNEAESVYFKIAAADTGSTPTSSGLGNITVQGTAPGSTPTPVTVDWYGDKFDEHEDEYYVLSYKVR